GQVVAFFAGEHAAAASAIDRALALNPNSAHAWMVGGWVQCMLNRPDAAIDSLRRGLRLSPLDPLGWMFKNWLALAHLVAGATKTPWNGWISHYASSRAISTRSARK